MIFPFIVINIAVLTKSYRHVLFIGIVFISHQLYAQTRYSEIYGKVVDMNSGKPLPNVDVFISGTTLGAATDENGNFKIVSITEGTKSIVASTVGYDPSVKTVTAAEGRSYNVDFELEQKTYEMGTVEVFAKAAGEWKNDLTIFKNFFLGYTDFSKECKIENEVTINFVHTDEGNLDAICPEPLIIANYALGYKIICILLNFSCNNLTGEVRYLYYPQFLQLNAGNDSIKHVWEENRKISYLNSFKRFLKYLVSADHKTNEYVIRNNMQDSSYLHYSKEDKNYVLSFEKYLYVDNNVTGDRGWLYLPNKTAVIDKNGSLVNPMSILTLGSFAEQGIANLLPDNYNP